MESCVPPGFRFHPTDEELVGYYLKKKVSSQKIDFDVIRDIDLYRIEPWDLQDRCRIGYEEQSEWYFFSHKDKKYPTGTRTNRATMAGFWKATGRDKAVYDKLRLIGMRKTLVFYKGRAPNGQKSDWIMHEYRLETDENGPPQEEGWVVCRAFKKRSNLQTRTNEDWDSSYYYEEHSLDYISTHHQQQQQSNLLCKQEIEVDINMINHPRLDQCIQLPRLESPSLPLIKPPALFSMLEDGENNIIEKVTTDWRALDRFVASQLSQEERVEGEGLCKFAVHHNQDMALLLLQSSSSGSGGGGREQGQLALDGFLSSSSDCDFDVCILGK